MKWSPPRIVCRFRLVSGRASFRSVTVACFLTSFFLSGCASIPAMTASTPGVVSKPDQLLGFTADEQARMAAMPAVPEFDKEGISVVVQTPSVEPALAPALVLEAAKSTTPADTSGTAPMVAAAAPVESPALTLAGGSTSSTAPTAGEERNRSSDVPKPVDPAPTVAKAVDTKPETSVANPVPQVASAEASGVKSSTTSPTPDSKEALSSLSEKPMAEKSESEGSSAKTDVAMGGEGNRNSPMRSDAGIGRKNSGGNMRDNRTTSTKPSGVVVKAPESFSWKPAGKSAGNRPFQVVHIGDEGYRTLVLGSVGGHDPLAIELVDRLARHLHRDSIILGGFECTIVRTMNPDGEASKQFRNQKGEYVNSGFPRTLADASKVSMPEAKFVLEQIDRLKPQRIVHIRTITSGVGVVATGFSSQTAAREAAEWMKFKVAMLPDKSNPGQIERYVSTSGVADMITIGIPEATPKDELWDLYGDTILNLLLAEDFATREIARKQ